MDFVRHPEEAAAADPPRIVSKGHRDRGDGARWMASLTAEAKSRPSVLFHVGRRKIEDSAQITGRLVVHSGETCAGQEDLRFVPVGGPD